MNIDNRYMTVRQLYGNVIKARIDSNNVRDSWDMTGEISDLFADYYTIDNSSSYTLHMIINEVLENAIKYSNSLSVIDLLAYKKNDVVVFSITNELNAAQWDSFRHYVENKDTRISIKEYIETLYENSRFQHFGGLGLLLLMKDNSVDMDFTFYKSIDNRYMVLTKVSIRLDS
jgi:hypothetical protein